MFGSKEREWFGFYNAIQILSLQQFLVTFQLWRIFSFQ